MTTRLALIFSLLILLLFNTNGIAQYSKLWDFAGGTIDGKNPQGSLTYDGTYLYGTTYQGGSSNYGMIFKIKPDGTGYTQLFSFAGTNSGIQPFYETLLLEGNFLYGMTTAGGIDGLGIIYKIQTDGT
ncbi:MAG: choice-of-anchor tandem repeat GloVer-containing protein, partial [Bacteroidia bacterium]